MNIVTAPMESQLTYAALYERLADVLHGCGDNWSDGAAGAVKVFRRALEAEALRLVRMPDSLQLARRVLSIADALAAPVDLPEPVEEGEAR